jgi:hypothetical protein
MLVIKTAMPNDTRDMVCIACGCDDHHACVVRTPHGPEACHWIQHGLCSGCGCEWPEPHRDKILFRQTLATDMRLMQASITAWLATQEGAE